MERSSEVYQRLNIVLDGIKAAEVALLKRWQDIDLGEPLATVLKSDGSLVSVADHESELIICSAIRRAFPGATIVSEEDSASHWQTTRLRWILDPLDNTKAFVNGGTDFSVLVSLWDGEQPVFSVVSYPALGQRYVANGGKVVSKARDSSNHKNEGGLLLGVHCELHHIQSGVEGSECISSPLESTRALIDVAARRARGAVIRLCGHRSWDIAAPAHIVMASGGFISNEYGEAIQFSGADINATFVVAGGTSSMKVGLLTVVSMLVDT